MVVPPGHEPLPQVMLQNLCLLASPESPSEALAGWVSPVELAE